MLLSTLLTLSVVGVAIPTGVHLSGSLSDDFFCTVRVEIELADVNVQRLDAQQQQRLKTDDGQISLLNEIRN